MKHIALLLAIIIFALSAVSCGDLTYYKDAQWDCPQEEFYDRYHEPVEAKIMQVIEASGVEVKHFVEAVDDDAFRFVFQNDTFVCLIYFYCEELWGHCNVNMYFYGEDEGQLRDYDAQKKYLDLVNEVTHLIAYKIDPELNMYENAYNSCIENNVNTFEKEIHYDAMTGVSKYGVVIDSDKYAEHGRNNYYYFEGLLRGDLA